MTNGNCHGDETTISIPPKRRKPRPPKSRKPTARKPDAGAAPSKG